MDKISTALSFISVGVVVTFILLGYVHKNFAPKDSVNTENFVTKESFHPELYVSKETFDMHREDIDKRDGEIKDWMLRLETKMDRILERSNRPPDAQV